MDLVTTAQLVGNFKEFVGSIGVVVTLVYLAIQIRANTRTMVQANPMLRGWWENDTNPTNYPQEFVDAINQASGIDATKLFQPLASRDRQILLKAVGLCGRSNPINLDSRERKEE